MSCFKGKMLEYRNVSIDRFDGERNLSSTAYFLSHCHEDHTVGLKEPAFIKRLKASNDVFLYCSEVTKILLVENEKYSHLEKYIKTLPVDEPTTVAVPESTSCKVDYVTVTQLHAAHCPGSVMFLFEGDEGTVLYTGDFRWEINRAKDIAALHHGDKVKRIKSLYIDTTFCHGNTFYIPSRQDCVEAVHSLVAEWLDKGKGHVVHFTPRSHYGHEHLLKEIAERTDNKVHVSAAKYKVYEQIQDLKDVFTMDSNETPIHACPREKNFSKNNYGELPCDHDLPEDVLVKKMTILPSTMYFTKKLTLSLKDIINKDRGIYRACYCFHSSYSEIKNLVTYLKPERVRPNVKPPEDDNIMQVQERLNGFLREKHKQEIQEPVLRFLGTLRKKRFIKKKKIPASLSSDSEGLVFGTPEKEVPKRNAVTPEKSETGRGDSLDNVTSSQGDAAVTPVKNEGSDYDSSYNGSGDEEELSDTGLILNNGARSTLSTPSQSLLEAIDLEEEAEDIHQYRICNVDDAEQTDGNEIIPSKSLSDYDVDAIQSESERVIDGGNDNEKCNSICSSSKENGDNSHVKLLENESVKHQEHFDSLSTPSSGYLAGIDSQDNTNDSADMKIPKTDVQNGEGKSNPEICSLNVPGSCAPSSGYLAGIDSKDNTNDSADMKIPKTDVQNGEGKSNPEICSLNVPGSCAPSSGFSQDNTNDSSDMTISKTDVQKGEGKSNSEMCSLNVPDNSTCQNKLEVLSNENNPACQNSVEVLSSLEEDVRIIKESLQQKNVSNNADSKYDSNTDTSVTVQKHTQPLSVMTEDVGTENGNCDLITKRADSVISISDSESDDEEVKVNIEQVQDQAMDCDSDEWEMFENFKRSHLNTNGIIDLTQSESEDEEASPAKRMKKGTQMDEDSDETLPPSQNTTKKLQTTEDVMILDSDSDDGR